MLKKFISFLLVAMLLVLTSCGNGGVVETTDDTKSNTTSQYTEKYICNKIIATYRPTSPYEYPDTEMLDESPNTKAELDEIMRKYIRISKMYLDWNFSIIIEWRDTEDLEKIEDIKAAFPNASSSIVKFNKKNGVLAWLHFPLKGMSLSELVSYEPLYDIVYELAQSEDVVKIYIGESACPYIVGPA